MKGLNPNRTNFLYRYIRIDNADDALRLGYLPHPECFIGSPYALDSILMEWLCQCPDPLSSSFDNPAHAKPSLCYPETARRFASG